jgi:cyanophycinase
MRVLLLALLFIAPAAAMPCGTEGVPLPGAPPRSQGPARGTLLLLGGGEIGPEVQAEMARLAGGTGARWVVVITAASDEDVPGLRLWNPVTPLGQPQAVLHTRSRAEADTAAFATPLEAATAVWFEGGRQTRLMDAYAGTRTEAALRGVLDRGGLVAGTSAGATIQGDHMVRAGGGGIIPPPRYAHGFGYVSNLAVDQHVDAWNRDMDLVPMVRANPGVLGLGLDEGTGVVVQGDALRVVGPGRVLVHDGADHGVSPFWCLRAGDRLSLATWARMPANAAP